jgi:hypothetical protein
LLMAIVPASIMNIYYERGWKAIFNRNWTDALCHPYQCKVIWSIQNIWFSPCMKEESI